MGKGRTVPAAAEGGLLRESEVGTAGERASAGPSPFSRPPTRGRSGRADGQEGRLGGWHAAPGDPWAARPPRAGGCPRRWRRAEAAERGVRAGEGCRVAAGLPQPPPLPAQLLGDRAGEGVILHIPHLAPPPASIKLAAGGSPALRRAPVGRGRPPAVA